MTEAFRSAGSLGAMGGLVRRAACEALAVLGFPKAGKMSWMRSVGWPSPGWSRRAGVEFWGVGSCVNAEQVEMLVHSLFGGGIDWRDPRGEADAREVLSAMARRVAGQRDSLRMACEVFEAIPASAQAGLGIFFRSELTTFDPGWVGRRLDWRRPDEMPSEAVEKRMESASAEQEAFLVAQAIASSPAAPQSSGGQRSRL